MSSPDLPKDVPADAGEPDAALLRRAAACIREAAANAACDGNLDRVCCWSVQRLAGQESVIETRLDEEDRESMDYVAIPFTGRVAEHIALWGPNAGRAVAAWLEAAAELHEPMPGAAPAAAVIGPDGALRGCQWCGDEDAPCSDLRHALALAREILGMNHAGR